MWCRAVSKFQARLYTSLRNKSKHQFYRSVEKELADPEGISDVEKSLKMVSLDVFTKGKLCFRNSSAEIS